MRKLISALLAAATALTPLAAQAQDGRRGGRWGEDRAEGRAQRSEPVERSAQTPRSAPERRPERQADWQQRANQARSDRAQVQTGQYRPDQTRPDQGRPDQGRPDQPRGVGSGDGRFYSGRDERRRDYRRSYADRRDDWNARAGFDDRRSWNRGWRTDNRYDWTRGRAENRYGYRLPRYYSPSGWSGGYRRFGIGASLSSLLWTQDYWIEDPYEYRLPPAYGPYRWVRYYNDALLVDLRGGQVVDVVHDIFW